MKLLRLSSDRRNRGGRSVNGGSCDNHDSDGHGDLEEHDDTAVTGRLTAVQRARH